MRATMHCYCGMSYEIGRGSRRDVYEAVRGFLKRRADRVDGTVTWISPVEIECEDDGRSISNYDGVIRIGKESKSEQRGRFAF